MNSLTIAIVGAGRATELHMMGYRKVHNIQVQIKYVYDVDFEKAQKAKELYGIEKVAKSFEEILNDKEVDVIDICTPPYTHKDMIIRGLKSDKHVICEKPLCGYFGSGHTDRDEMYETVLRDLDELEEVVNSSNKQLMYAENFIYAPAIQKAAEIIKAKGSKILYAKGEESLAGSTSPVAGYWEKNGGGSLMRVGCHPLTAILYLKKLEDKNNEVVKVLADIGNVTTKLSEYEHRHIKANPYDVEDTATVCLTFTDGSKAVVIACDSRLGGSKNYVELYCNDTCLECNLTMNNAMSVYLLDEEGMGNVEISEMLQTKCGWNNPFLSDEVMRGYINEIQDFMESASENKKAKSNFDIAKECIKTIYRAYCSKG